MSATCRKVLLKLAMRTWTFLKHSHAGTLSIWTDETKPRVKSELRKQQYTVTLSDCSHLTHVIVIWQIQKFICYCNVIALLYFVFEGNFQVQAPGGLYSEERFNGEFFALRGLGGLYLEGLIHGGAYFRNFTVVYKTHFIESSVEVSPRLFKVVAFKIGSMLCRTALWDCFGGRN